MSDHKLVLVAGPSGSGKSTFANGLADHIQASGRSTTVLALDNYYRDLRHLTKEERDRHNFDEPNAWEHERIDEEARRLKDGLSIDMPVYDFSSHLRADHTRHVEPTDYIILEGLFALCYPSLNRLADLKIFVDLEDEVALERRIQRDVRERGRTRESVVDQYLHTVQPANDKYIRPSAKEADFRVPGDQKTADQIEVITLI